MFRNSYICPFHAPIHTWEQFGEKAAPANCPRCGRNCVAISSIWAERNERYRGITGYGFGMVMSPGEADPLKELEDTQIECLLSFLLLGDVGEVAPDEHLLGRWALKDGEKFHSEEEEWRMCAAAALVYLSGRLGCDFTLLRREKRKLPECSHTDVYTPKEMPLAEAMQQARDQVLAALDNLTPSMLLNVAEIVLGHTNPVCMDLLRNIPPDEDEDEDPTGDDPNEGTGEAMGPGAFLPPHS